MREKVQSYLEKPTKKLYAQLTTMEQKFVDAQLAVKKESEPKAKPQGK
jgi:hypothetical protein